MNSDTLILAPVFLPLFAASMILLAKSFFPTKVRRVTEYAGITVGLGLPLLIVLLLYPTVVAQGSLEIVIGSYSPSIGIIYKFDGLSLAMIILAISVTLPSWIYSRKVGPAHSHFTALVLIQNATISAISMSADIFNLFVCMEIMGLVAYVLIASNQNKGSTFASFSYLMFSSSAMVFFLLGTFGLYRLTGSLSYDGIATALAGLTAQQQHLALLSIVLLIVPMLLRVAVMPLSSWLVSAHSKAPHAVSALLSGVLLKIPLFALGRIFLLSELTQAMALPISYAGAATALVAVVLALAQSDAKQLLAYHSISQVGYIVTAWALALHHGVGSSLGGLLLAASFFHAFSHALFKSLLFLSVGTATDAAGNRNVYTLRGANATLHSEGERLPLTMICFFVGALAITAIPPFNGYFSKTLLTYSLKSTAHYTALSLASVGTVASFLKLSSIFLPGKQKLMLPKKKERPRFPFSLHLGLLVLAIASLLTGVYAQPLLSALGRLLAPESAIEAGASFFYSGPTLLKTLYTTAAGGILYALAVSVPGKKLLTRVQKLRSTFSDQYFGFALVIAALTVVFMA